MTASPQPLTGADFSALAGRLSMLAADDCEALLREAAEQGIAPTQWALQRGLLTAVQVEILDTLSQPDRAIAGYEILDVLGQGGMGVVYRARQKNLDRLVALKTVLVSQMSQAGTLARFEQEALTVAQLRHPNIVVAYDFGRSQGRLYLAMELVEGEELGELITRRGRLDERTAWVLARQAAAGLSHAAKMGVVHRDVKPANLLLVAPPEGFALPAGLPMVKITDFGLALLTSEQEVDERLTAAGNTLGTPRYMAPEQFQGSDVDLRADIYSLGATVYHMLAGAPPFPEKNLAQMLAVKLNGQAAPLREIAPGVSPRSAELVAAMMQRDRARRIPSYEELFQRINRLLHSDLPHEAAAGPSTERRSRGAGSLDATAELMAASTIIAPASSVQRSKRALVAALAGVLLVALGWVGWHRHLSGDSQKQRTMLLTPTEQGSFLYDGESLSGWKTVDGQWANGKDDEGSHVIAGKGLIRRMIPRQPAIENYRLSLGVCLHQASAVELHFGLSASSGASTLRHVLRLGREEAEIGRKSADRSPLTRIGAVRTIPADDRDAPVYHELRVERHVSVWLAFVDGQELGRAPVQPDGELPEFRVLTEGGPAWIESVQLTELALPGPVP